ncbi:ectomycorrhiza-regulated small secreted protein [Panaeolus papilionaceus]|nr:ectomycorrhiza-regulated small secreted protein [Panaeolus papilionaceus]
MDFVIHPLIRYSQFAIASGHPTGIVWDLRESPGSARRLMNLDEPLTPKDLAQYATTPPCVLLNITSDLFYGDRPIEARRLRGVTIGDVFAAIHDTLHQPVRRDEWENLTESQQKRISDVFDQRCRMSVDRDKTHAQGILRIDCLQHTTWFAGLSNSLEIDCCCILTLCRPK